MQMCMFIYFVLLPHDKIIFAVLFNLNRIKMKIPKTNIAHAYEYILRISNLALNLFHNIYNCIIPISIQNVYIAFFFIPFLLYVYIFGKNGFSIVIYHIIRF